jgi:proline iminopeptidase
MKEGYVNVTGGKVWYSLAGDRPDDQNLWTVKRFAEELASVRHALGLNRTHILGQSWGTMLALYYMVCLEPRGVRSAIFSGPFFSARRFISDARVRIGELPYKDRSVIERSEKEKRFDNEDYRNAIMLYYRKHLCRLDPWPVCLERTFENMGENVYNHMWGPSEFTLRGILKNFDITGYLNNIAVPVLFTGAEHDEILPATVEHYHKATPGSEMYIFEDASHEHHLEKQEMYISLVSGFLRRVERT